MADYYVTQQSYKLDIVPDSGWVVVFAAQNDNQGRQIVLEIYNQGEPFIIPDYTSIFITGVKENGNLFNHYCNYTGNKVLAYLFNDMTDVAGKTICLLRFYNMFGQQTASAKFVLFVDSTINPEEDIELNTTTADIFLQMLNEIGTKAAEVSSNVANLQSMVGAPRKAEFASEMVNSDYIYIYTGSEDGYVFGNWYYYNANEQRFVSGGIYNAIAVVTDSTLSLANVPADAKAVGQRVSGLGSIATDAYAFRDDAEAYAIGQRSGSPVSPSDVTYNNNSKYYSEQATTAEEHATESAGNAEAWAVGQRGGVDVGETDATFHNNAKYYSEVAEMAATTAGFFDLSFDDDGYLIYTRTENVALNFDIDDNGYLVWEVV